MVKFKTNNMLERILNKIFYWRYLRPQILDVTFVVSTGRTGTKFFETLFKNTHEDFYSVHEPRPDFFDLSMNKIRKNWSSDEIQNYINHHRKAVWHKMIKDRKKRYVECNPFNSLLLDELKLNFPKAKFIIITRDPKTYTKSGLNKSPNSTSIMFYADNDGRKRLSALDYENDKYNSQWKNFTRLEKISWYWNKCNLILIDFLEKNPKKSLHISFERLFGNSEEDKIMELKKLAKFSDFNLNEQKTSKILAILLNKKNSTEKVLFEGHENWSSEERSKFNELTAEASEKISKLKSNIL